MSPDPPKSVPIPHVLVVDDEAEVVELLRRYFEKHGFRVSTAPDAYAMRACVARESIDLILLDLGLPDADGLDLTRDLRKSWNGALIIVSGRGESVDRVVGLELGADDYVAKPFDLRELLARVRSVLRRVTPADLVSPEPIPSEILEFAGFRLHLRSRTLAQVDGLEISLTSGEFDLLKIFLEEPQRVLSRDDLMNRLHSREAGPYDRAIDMQVTRLRRKIETDTNRPILLKSVRGVGYIFSAEVRPL
ncbi:MAG: response regulator [Tahibacter sp.]